MPTGPEAPEGKPPTSGGGRRLTIAKRLAVAADNYVYQILLVVLGAAVQLCKLFDSAKASYSIESASEADQEGTGHSSSRS